MEFFNDPGVYVVQKLLPTPLEPQMPQLPTAIIGPLYSIVDQDVDTKTTVMLSATGVLGSIDDFLVPFPTTIEGAKIDSASVKVEIVKSDGRRYVLAPAHFLTDITSGVTISYVTKPETKDAFYAINDEIKGRSAGWSKTNSDMSGLEGAYIHLSYRILREDLNGRALKVQGIDGAQATLSKACLENPLGLAGLFATAVAPTTGIYFVPTKDYLTDTADEATEIQMALGVLEPIRVYSIVALSDDDTTHQKVANHCRAMSAADEKMFRINYGYHKMPSAQDSALLAYNGGAAPANDMELKQLQAEMLHLYGKSLSDERTHVLFQDFTATVDSELLTLPGYYLAAVTSAFKSSLPPRQGMTNYPVPGVVRELLYGKDYFKPSQLKHISAGGIYTYVQDVHGAPVRCRAQWTTNMWNNKTKQSSITWCRDFFSYTMIDTLSPLVGIRNVTDDTITEIHDTLQAIISALRQSGEIINAEILSIQVNKYDASRVDVIIRVTFPSPLDKIVIELQY